MKYSGFIKLQAIFLSFLCFLFAFSLASRVEAQYNTPLATAVTLSLNPENPGPNESVDAEVVSYATNIDAGIITWKVNGKTIKSARGLKNFSFTTGGMNTTTTLEVTVVTVEGETIKQSVEIRPSSVDLIWQTDSYVPPFYKGKAIFTHQDKIQFIALPHMLGSGSSEIPPSNLIYKWIYNGTVIPNASGYGKNIYSFTTSVISRPIKVEVEVTSPTLPGIGTARINLNPTEPMVLMYKKDPEYGIQFQKALLNSISLSDTKEIVVVGVPFFFSTPFSSNKNLLYTWNINGVPTDESRANTTKVFRQKEGTSGTSNISLFVENPQKILQTADNNFNLSFGGQ